MSPARGAGSLTSFLTRYVKYSNDHDAVLKAADKDGRSLVHIALRCARALSLSLALSRARTRAGRAHALSRSLTVSLARSLSHVRARCLPLSRPRALSRSSSRALSLSLSDCLSRPLSLSLSDSLSRPLSLSRSLTLSRRARNLLCTSWSGRQPSVYASFCCAAAQRRGNTFNGFKDVHTENGSSQGHDPALNGTCVPIFSVAVVHILFLACGGVSHQLASGGGPD